MSTETITPERGTPETGTPEPGIDSAESVIDTNICSQHDHPRSTWLIRSIRWYQRLVEGRPSPCRFFPSCSSYALEALEVHGTRRGGWLTIRRLARCRPLGPSGFDPVPPARTAAEISEGSGPARSRSADEVN